MTNNRKPSAKAQTADTVGIEPSAPQTERQRLTASLATVCEALETERDKDQPDDKIIAGLVADIRGLEKGIMQAEIKEAEAALMSATDPATLASLATRYEFLLTRQAESEAQKAEATAEAGQDPEAVDMAAAIAAAKADAELAAKAASAGKTTRSYATGVFLNNCAQLRASVNGAGAAFLALADLVSANPAAAAVVRATRSGIAYDLTSAKVSAGEKGVFSIGQSGLIPKEIIAPLADNHPVMLRSLEAVLRQQPNEAGQSPSMMILVSSLQGRGPLALDTNGLMDPASTLAQSDATDREDTLGITRDGQPRAKARGLSKAIISALGRTDTAKTWETVDQLRALVAKAAADRPSVTTAAPAAVKIESISWL